MNIPINIPELIKDGVITQEIAGRIQDHYKKKKGALTTNHLFVVFGILGAILMGLGITLIIAHNWDELLRETRIFFAFLPLILGQILCGYILVKKQSSIVWKESGTAFLFFAVGASIFLISQIYHIQGDLSSFLLTWMILCLPLIYIMKTSVVSLLYIVGITYYVAETSYFSYPSSESYPYWLLFIAVLPHYFQLCRKKAKSNFVFFHNWLIPLSIVMTLGAIVQRTGELIYIAYFSLFGLFYLIGNSDFFIRQKVPGSSYKILGSLGTIFLLLLLSSDWYWKGLEMKVFQFNEVVLSPEFLAASIISLLTGSMLYLQQKNKPLNDINPLVTVFILFIVTFIVGLYSAFIAVVLINLYVFLLGILTIRDGFKQSHLGILNCGVLIIAALVIWRFFDSDISFIVRGFMFLLVGLGFFVANYWILKKKTNE